MTLTFMLAPIEGFTDPAFRTLCYRHGADLTFTEMSRVASLARNNQSTMSRIRIPDGTPTVIQLLGPKESDLKNFLNRFDPTPGFIGFNINLGCPSPEMLAIGHGCAMIKRIAKVNALIKIIESTGYSCSIKLRLGMNEYEKKKKAYLNLIASTNAYSYIIHARHGKEEYIHPADYSVYPECVDTGKKIIANGDISTKEQVDSLYQIGIKGVMVGRAALEHP